MEKRLVLAVVLMIGVVLLVNVLFPPAPPPERPSEPDSVPAESQAPAPRAREEPARAAAGGEGAAMLPGLAAEPEGAAEDTVWVSGPLYRLAFAGRGARLVSARMLQFESLAPGMKGQPAELVPPAAEGFFAHRWVVGEDTLDLRDVHFAISPSGGLALRPGGGEQVLRFVYEAPGTAFRVELSYTFHPESYVIGFEGRLQGVPATGWWMIGLGPGLLSNEWDQELDYKSNLAFAGRGPDGVQSKRVGSIAAGETASLNGPFDWVAVRTKYFATALVLPPDAGPERRFSGLLITGLPEQYRARGVASFPVPRSGRFAYHIYLGPQDFGQLAAVGHDLDQVHPYGYRWLQPILRPLAGAITALLVWSHRNLRLGYGWILILFGIGIRVVLFPLYQKSMRSQMATMRVQPLMKEIQTKYKNDPQRLQQEMVKLYREHKINPLGGCLPMLLPFPILIALFFVFRDTIEFRGVPFLWLPDLSRPDPLYIIPILMGFSIFLLQWITQRSAPQANPQMKMMMWVMPVIMVVIFLKFAAGLNLYYATMNLASLPQQLYLAKERRAAMPPAAVKAKT